MKTIDFTVDIIDSQDIIVRQEELQDDLDWLNHNLQEAQDALTAYLKTNAPENDSDELVALQDAVEEAQEKLDDFNSSYDKDELDTLNEVIEQGEDCSDWRYGEALINENYFVEYIKDLINDCYEMPKEFDSGKWPWNHITIDYARAAEEAKADYTEIYIEGTTYYIRN